MEQEINILIQYGEADMKKRLHLFLQFPDLRRGFQEIERKDLAFRTGSASLPREYKEKYFSNISLLRKTGQLLTQVKGIFKLLGPFRSKMSSIRASGCLGLKLRIRKRLGEIINLM